jgi:hypothetical protein
MLELIEPIAAASGSIPERRRLDARALEEPRDPSLDRRIQLDLSAVDEQRNFPDTDSTQTNRSPFCQQPSIGARVDRRRRSSPLSSQRAYAYRAEVYPLDFSTSFGVRLATEGRPDQVNPLANSDRPAVSPEQRARPGTLVQETPHG